MAVSVTATDTWLSHLLFTQTRPTEIGPADGLFYGVMQGVGDAGGGNVTLNGNVSFDRKEDWIYQIRGYDLRVNSTGVGGDAFIQFATGPSIGGINPIFTIATDAMLDIVNNAVSIFQSEGPDTIRDLPVFGDKKLAGPLSLMAAGFQDNVDAATYTMSVWGFLFRYSSFFRGVSPFVG